jgi:hypothetical protein
MWNIEGIIMLQFMLWHYLQQDRINAAVHDIRMEAAGTMNTPAPSSTN